MSPWPSQSRANSKARRRRNRNTEAAVPNANSANSANGPLVSPNHATTPGGPGLSACFCLPSSNRHGWFLVHSELARGRFSASIVDAWRCPVEARATCTGQGQVSAPAQLPGRANRRELGLGHSSPSGPASMICAAGTTVGTCTEYGAEQGGIHPVYTCARGQGPINTRHASNIRGHHAPTWNAPCQIEHVYPSWLIKLLGIRTR